MDKLLSGNNYGIGIFKYREHTVLVLTLVKLENFRHSMKG